MTVLIYSAILTSLFHISAVSSYHTPYPIFFGGAQGPTVLRSFDISPTYNFVVLVGDTADTTLQSFTTNVVPFISVYSGDEMLLQWAQVLNLPGYTAAGVVASVDQNTFAVITYYVGRGSSLMEYVFVYSSSG